MESIRETTGGLLVGLPTYHNICEIILIGVHIPHISHPEYGMTWPLASCRAEEELGSQHHGGAVMPVAIEGGIGMCQGAQMTIVR